MAEKSLRCDVVTPEGKIFGDEVDSVIVPAHDGEIGILPGHAPLLCKLGPGQLRIATAKSTQNWFVDGGFCQVTDNEIMVLTPMALRPNQLNRQQAQALLEEAAKMPITDEISGLRKSEAQARARAMLRMAP